MISIWNQCLYVVVVNYVYTLEIKIQRKCSLAGPANKQTAIYVYTLYMYMKAAQLSAVFQSWVVTARRPHTPDSRTGRDQNSHHHHHCHPHHNRHSTQDRLRSTCTVVVIMTIVLIIWSLKWIRYEGIRDSWSFCRAGVKLKSPDFGHLYNVHLY